MTRECDFCTNSIYTIGARAVYFTMLMETRGSPIICSPSIPLTAYKAVRPKNMCASGFISKNIRVGRSLLIFF